MSRSISRVESRLKKWASLRIMASPLHGDEPSDSRILLASTLIIAVGILTTHFFHSDSATSVPVSVRETSEKNKTVNRQAPCRTSHCGPCARIDTHGSGRNGVYMFVNASFNATDALVTVLCFDLLHDCSLTNWHCCPRPSASASFFMGFESEARGSG